MKSILLIFIGGGLGSVFRYWLSKLLNNEATLPYGTLLANVLGSLIIGFTIGYLAKSNINSQMQYLLIATGFCGGFTTFSTFAFENYSFLKNQAYIQFFTYSFGSFLLALIAVMCGIFLAKLF